MSFGFGEAAWADIDARLRRLAGNEAELRRRFWKKLRGLAARLPFAEDLIAAHYCAFDRQTPLHVKAALVGALAYFVLPTDFIPDVLRWSATAMTPPCWRRRSSLFLLISSRTTAKRRSRRWRACAASASKLISALWFAPKRFYVPSRLAPVRRSTSRVQGRSTILPITLRSAIAFSAAEISASG